MNKGFAISIFLLMASFSTQIRPEEIKLTKESNSPSLPGIYSVFEEFIKLNKNNYSNALNNQKGIYSNLDDLTDPSSVSLDSDFLSAIIFYTPTKYLILGNKDKCSFYDLYLANLLKTPAGEVNNFLIHYINSANEEVSALVKPEVFKEKVIEKVCPASIRFQKYFNKKNIQRTLKEIRLETPKSISECKSIHEKLTRDYKTPYLCLIENKVSKIDNLRREIRNTPTSNYQKLGPLNLELQEAQSYKKVLNENALDYLQNLCDNLDKKELFCDRFFTTSFWDKALKNEVSKFALLDRCKSILNKETLKDNDFIHCIKRMEASPNLCSYAGTHDALYPSPDCKTTSELLSYSRINYNYEECPSYDFNTALINSGRILQHFSPIEGKDASNCSVIYDEAYLNFTYPIIQDKGWGIHACFDNQIHKEERCYPTYFGGFGESKYSITKVVSDILYQTKGTSKNLNCELVKSSDYKPVLLKFSSGCFIITPDRNCYNSKCNFKIILDQKEINLLKLKVEPKTEYIPKSIATEKYSFLKIFENELKKKVKKVRNVSDIKFFLNQNKNAIVHGVGCRENLLPSFFRSRSFSKCTPLPFIVDGLKEDKGEVALITRTAIDNLYSPRLISWSNIFQSVTHYQEKHPLREWSLYVSF